MDRLGFLDEEPPPGYIAGIGRGATGFAVQADVAVGNKRPVAGKDGQFDDADDGKINYVQGGDDDEEAKLVFDEIDKKLQMRREGRKRRKKKPILANSGQTLVEVKETTAKQSIEAISAEFDDAKQGLAQVTEDQWENIPESGDFTRKNKRRRQELQMQQRFYRNDDSITLGMRDSATTNDTVDVAQISKARDQVLSSQLSGNTVTTVDTEQYLAQLEGQNAEQEESEATSSIGNYARTRSLFGKMRKNDPYKADNWIASARLEVEAKNIKRAKRLIVEGCSKCPKSEEIWLVSLEIHGNDLKESRVVVADAVQYNPESLQLWLIAAELEQDDLSKKRVIMKALDFLPDSATLWLKLVDYEDDPDMKLRMAQKATTLVPDSVALWLKLASLQPSKESLETLETARSHVKPEDVYKMYISSSKLEEKSSENEIKVNRIMDQCFEKEALAIDFYGWLHEAVLSESESCPLTTRSIVFHCMPLAEDVLETWQSDAENAAANNPEVARSIYMFVTSNYPEHTEVWEQYIQFEKSQRRMDDLYVVYELAIKACPKYPLFYLMYAKDKWLVEGDTAKARSVLDESLELNDQHEDLYFAAAKLLWKTGNREAAIEYLQRCRDTVETPSARAWYKQVTLERCLEHYSEALDLVDEGLQEHPKESKLYLEMGQIYESLKQYDQAINAYSMGTRECPDSSALWISMSRIYQELNKTIKARSTLEEAGTKVTDELDRVYIERLNLEGRESRSAALIVAKGLREMPKSGMLWAEQIRMAKPVQRKNFYTPALNGTDDSPYVLLEVARDLWQRSKLLKAKQFFDAALEKDPDFGDIFIYYHAFLTKHGKPEEVAELEGLFLADEPHHGPLWCSFTKNLSNIEKQPLELLLEASLDINQ